jgi:hypothetical protein
MFLHAGTYTTGKMSMEDVAVHGDSVYDKDNITSGINCHCLHCRIIRGNLAGSSIRAPARNANYLP